jgi:prepilin-type N-terminal cleavage/methylation domain-containing protein
MRILARQYSGFTIVELMVVIAIITVMVTIVLASIMGARQDSRDKRRLSDLANYAHAITLYKEKHRDYPSYPSGIELGRGGALDAELLLIGGNLYTDPQSADDPSEYGYWYYSNFLCNGERIYVVLATSVEKDANSNIASVCGGSTDANLADAHIISLK